MEGAARVHSPQDGGEGASEWIQPITCAQMVAHDALEPRDTRGCCADSIAGRRPGRNFVGGQVAPIEKVGVRISLIVKRFTCYL